MSIATVLPERSGVRYAILYHPPSYGNFEAPCRFVPPLHLSFIHLSCSCSFHHPNASQWCRVWSTFAPMGLDSAPHFHPVQDGSPWAGPLSPSRLAEPVKSPSHGAITDNVITHMRHLKHEKPSGPCEGSSPSLPQPGAIDALRGGINHPLRLVAQLRSLGLISRTVRTVPPSHSDPLNLFPATVIMDRNYGAGSLSTWLPDPLGCGSPESDKRQFLPLFFFGRVLLSIATDCPEYLCCSYANHCGCSPNCLAEFGC